MIELDQTGVAQGAAGVGGLFLAGRWFLSWWRKQDHTDKLADDRADFTDELKKEVEELRALVAEMRAAHDEHLRLIAMLEKSNALLKMLLRMRGVTDEELRAAGVIP